MPTQGTRGQYRRVRSTGVGGTTRVSDRRHRVRRNPVQTGGVELPVRQRVGAPFLHAHPRDEALRRLCRHPRVS
eukprot:3477921-Rhodomonas_salina.2